jgi:hypothetical protein
MSGLPLRYRTDRFYPIACNDSLIHWAWVKNTVHGPWFLAFCNTVEQPRGAEERSFMQPNCLGCLSLLDAEDIAWAYV